MRESSIYEIYNEIDHILELGPNPQLVKRLFSIIDELNKGQMDYFFKEVKSVEWFFPLKQKGHFSPGEASTRGWNILPYLERVSEQVQKPENEKYAEELLEIINNVTKYHIEHNRELDNDYIWWHFVKILLNVPNDKIVKYLKDNEIDMGQDWIKGWIDSKDNTLSASDIGNKLLPKFLTKKSPDIEIAEGIVRAITEIRWESLSEERKKSYLETKDAEARTVVNPFWLVECFKKSAQKIGELCGENVIYGVADKLKGILKYEHKAHQADIEFNQNTYRIGAARVRDGKYGVKDFDFHCSVGKLKKSDLEAVKDDIYGKVALKPEPLFIFDLEKCDSKEGFIKYVKYELSKKDRVVNLAQSENIDKKLRNLYDGLYSDYSYIWFGSLARMPSVGFQEADLLLSIFLRDILAAKCESDAKAGKTIMDKFLGKEYQFPLFRRLVLFVMGNDWTEYGEFFWGFLKDNPEALNESDYEAEIYKLLQNNVSTFTDNEKKKIKTLIRKGPRHVPDEKQEHYIAYWKQKWYSAMKKDDHFAKLFKEQKAITKIKEIEPPGKEIVEHVGWGPSPLTKEDILSFGTNEEMAEYLRKFKLKKDVWGEPTERGLAEVLKAGVKEKPERFVDDLKPFFNVDYLYVHNILRGLEEAWKEKKSFNWGKLFEFAREYINKSGFWKEGKEAQGHDWKVTHIWIINIIADLIQGGTRDDSWAFPEDYFELAEELLDIIIDKLPVEKDEGDRNAVSRALNTSYGQAITAMILLSLRKARVEDKKGVEKDVRWNPSKYEALLGKGVIEAFTLFGQYMPNFFYLNKSWVEDKVKEFESLDREDIRWRSFMEGYLFGPRVYRDLYKLMRKHYLRAIEVGFEQENTEEHLIDHITIGYLRGYESLKGADSLFRKIMDKWDYSKLSRIVDFFWSQSRHLVEEGEKKEGSGFSGVRERIIDFWQWTYKDRDTIKKKLKDDYGKMLSDLSSLTILLGKIDSENSKWLLLSAPHVGMGSDSSFFIEYLNKFEDRESIQFIGKIFLEMLSAATPTHDKEHIKAIVEKIYRFGNKTEADEICEIYGRREIEFLRVLYEKYNKN